jgi:hypothetical protein
MNDKTESTDVQNGKVNVNCFNFNVPTIVAVLGVGWGVASYIKGMEARIEKIEEYRVTRSSTTDRKFDDIQQALIPLANMPYRVNVLEQQATAINIRIDRFTELISNTMELIRKDVNTLGTKVEVLSEKIDNMAAQPKKASMNVPP